MPWTFDLDECSTPRVRRLIEMWQVLRQGRPVPLRSTIDPAHLKDLLPNLLIADIERDPFRVRYRLVGTAVVSSNGFDFTGRYVDELLFNDQDERWEEAYCSVAENARPIVGRTALRTSVSTLVGYEYAIFPLSKHDGETVDQTLAIEDYSGVDARMRLYLNPTRPK